MKIYFMQYYIHMTYVEQRQSCNAYNAENTDLIFKNIITLSPNILGIMG